MKNDRLFRIIYILLEKESVTAPELARTLEVSVRTVYRDIEALSMAGVPVFASQGKGGGISIMPGYTFDKALLTDDDQNQILFAVQSVQAVGTGMEGLVKKLGAAFRKDAANWIEVDFSRWGMRREDNRKFELLKRAILEKTVLQMSYCGSSGALTERRVKPIRLIFKAKNWYMQAFCLRAEDFRLFKISRIVSMTLTDEKFTDSFTELPSTDGDDQPPTATQRVRLRFQPSIAFRVYDEFEHGEIEKQPDGSLIVTTELPTEPWSSGYMLSFGAQVDILEPASLREQVAKNIKNIYEHYKT